MCFEVCECVVVFGDELQEKILLARYSGFDVVHGLFTLTRP